MDTQSFFHPPKFLDQNDQLIEHFWSLVGSTGPLRSAWLLAMNQVAAAHPGLAPLLPIGSHDPKAQRGIEFLGSSLKVLRVKPMDYLIERLHGHAPDLVRVCGKYLHYNLESRLLSILRQRLGFPPEPPLWWRGEFLTADNPIRFGPHTAGKAIVEIPEEATTKHDMQARQYRNAFRPAKRPGRPRKPPGASRTHHMATTNAEALRAWKLHQDGADRSTIAQALFPDSPRRTEQERRRLLVKVDRRIARGRRLASPPPTR